MKVVTPDQMKTIDSVCINEMGIPGVVLMENAALRVVEQVEADLGTVRGKRIAIFAGKGNNGGDALACARHLFNKGGDIKVYLTAGEEAIGGDAGINLGILRNMRVPLFLLQRDCRLEDAAGELAHADIVLDGIFGTGLRGQAAGFQAEVIEMVNRSGRPVIAIDIPSGVDGRTGKAAGASIRAYKTVTFGLPKLGNVLYPGAELCGELATADIGVPRSVVDGIKVETHLIDRETAASIIPQRTVNSHKGDYGRVFVLTGSAGMTGAGCLAAGAALRTGAGLVYAGVPSSLLASYDSVAEVVKVPLEDGGAGFLGTPAADRIAEWLEKTDVAAVGPGLGTHPGTVDLVHWLIKHVHKPVVIDADALNAVSQDVSVLKNLGANPGTDAVITPHPGEMARLCGISTVDVQNNRLQVAAEFAARWKVITVLKGAATVVALPDGTQYINTTGNAGMATAGTGDVLTGVIAGLIGQGVRPDRAAVAGVYLHGLAGDRAARVKGEHGLIAGDLAAGLPYVIKKLSRG